MEITRTYDVHFNDDNSSNSLGFATSYNRCIDFIENYNGTNHSYFADYKGGTVSIICIETGKEEFSTTIK
jgi:hypothetical protein